MKKLLKSIFSPKKRQKPDVASQEVNRDAKTGMFQTMERVDKQIGRAVTRLSER